MSTKEIGVRSRGWPRGTRRRAAVRWSARRRGATLADHAEADQAVHADRFTQGWLTATLLFCVGPLTILGTLDDGLGRGIDKLAVKSTLDGFASIAFAASFDRRWRALRRRRAPK